MPELNPHQTFRCRICGINWPLYAPLSTCPICGTDCTAYTLRSEVALTLEEANELLAERTGQTIVPRPPAKKPKGRNPTGEEIRELYAALDDWAHRMPPWAR